MLPVRDLASIGVLEHLAEGTGSSVFAIDGEPGAVLKQFHRPAGTLFGELGRPRARLSRLRDDARRLAERSVAWPTAVVADGGSPFGVLLTRAGERFMTSSGPRRLRALTEADAAPAPDIPGRIALVRALARLTTLLNGLDITLGESIDRALWTDEGTPELFLLGGDRFRVIGGRPARPEAPPSSTRDDARRLVVLTLRVVLGRHDVSADSATADPGLARDLGPKAERWLEWAAGGVWPSAAQWHDALAAHGKERSA